MNQVQFLGLTNFGRQGTKFGRSDSLAARISVPMVWRETAHGTESFKTFYHLFY